MRCSMSEFYQTSTPPVLQIYLAAIAFLVHFYYQVASGAVKPICNSGWVTLIKIVTLLLPDSIL